VLGDSPAGIGPDVLDSAAHADRVLVVTTPEPAALTDAYSVMKALDAHARSAEREIPTPDVFVNLATDAAHARGVAGRLRAACERFLCRSPRLVGWMPRSRGVLSAAGRQEPFVVSDPRSVPARAMRQLARRFSDLAAGAPALAAASQGVSGHGR
jgi:flagellar biosynthesis protein FlhG